MLKIALDAMGGDHAPEAIIDGALTAAKDFNIHIILVGNKTLIQSLLPSATSNISIQHAPEAIAMDESPLTAYKKKKESSIHIGLNLVKEGNADAFVSAGNTGAVMSCSLFILGRIPGVDRPALASLIPTKKGNALMLDMGSNIDSKPSHLEQYATMGHYFSSLVLHVSNPKVGLINIGEEEEKGNQVTQETYNLLKASSLNFVGNVEGKDVFAHKADVIICDGFVGNALLKFGEGLVEFILTEIKDSVKASSIFTKLGGLLLKPALKKLKKKIDYEEYGGAPLLGINGVSIVAHGKSKEKAIVNAIRTAKETVETHVIEKISSSIQKEHASS